MQRFFFAAAAMLAATTLLMTGSSVSGQGKQDKVGKYLDMITKGLPEKAPATPKSPRKLLIYSKTAGFRHASIEVGVRSFVMMGDKTGAYVAHTTEDESIFEPEKLKEFDGVVMFSTTGDCLRPKGGSKEDLDKREDIYKKSLKDFVESGKGIIGIHAGADTYHNWKDYAVMMGGVFRAHPWNIFDCPVKLIDTKSPINAAFDGKDFVVKDEIYVFNNDTAKPTERHMLLAIDTDKHNPGNKGMRSDNFYAISWIANYGKGRNFYSSLGHREEIFGDNAIMKHYLAGIQFALGDLEADASPATKAP